MMRKELVWAAIIGISFGLIIAFGVWRVNSGLKPKGISTQNTPQPKAKNSDFQITLDKPQNNDVVAQGTTTVSGITKPLSWITFSGEEDDYIIQADEQGVFTQDVNLISGINQIKITAFDAADSQSIQKVLVVYSSAFQTKNTATSSAEIRIEELLNKPKAYIGIVTDITDSTIQIKTTDSQIKQISTSADNVTVIKTGTTNKTVKLTDIAIGDFIVGMGYISSSSVLAAQRILITPAITDPKVEAKFGNISDIDKNATLSKSIKAKLKTIKDTDQIIFVITKDKDILTLRSIFVIQKS